MHVHLYQLNVISSGITHTCNPRRVQTYTQNPMPPLRFKGVAHPSTSNPRQHIADVTAAEIDCERMGGSRINAWRAPVLVEHTGSPVGVVEHSWMGADGEMRVAGRVNDAEAARLVREGKMHGLSLGTSIVTHGDGSFRREHEELSVCERPARPGCYIDTIDGEEVRSRYNFSGACV